MTENTKYPELIQDVLSITDADHYPEIYNFLASALNEDGTPQIEPLEFVCKLRNIHNLPSFAWEMIVEILESEIEIGNADAMNDLGAMFYDGIGVPQDYIRAIYFYNMAAEHGSRQAQENLGYCYYYGRNGAVDYEKAFHYFALGAFDGHLISLYKIGDMYANGFYVKKNPVEAFYIYERCLQTMTDEAAPYAAGPVYLRLGDMWLKGQGIGVDAKNALICYQKAEAFLYDMVKKGDTKYRKSLRLAVEGQAKARELLNQELRRETTALEDNEYFCPNCNASLNKQKGFHPNLDVWTCTNCGTFLFDESVEAEKNNDILWYCSQCGDLLNKQLGFTDTKGTWTCTKCGHVKTFDTIYEIKFDDALLNSEE